MSAANSIATEYAHIVRTPGVLGGEPRVLGRRISVRNVVATRDLDQLRPEQIRPALLVKVRKARVIV